jgi:plasmid stability protein
MAKQASIQYTLRGVPREVDRALRERAASTGSSVNRLAIEALAKGLGQAQVRRDLSFLAGSLSASEGKALDAEVKRQRRADRKLWPARQRKTRS